MTRTALGIVTDTWTSPDRRPNHEGSELMRVITEDVDLADADIVAGLLNVVNILLVKMDNAGMDVPAVLADIGARYGVERS